MPFDLTGAPLISNFIGRSEELEEMKDLLLPSIDAKKQKVLILHGLGGIGKTQLSLEYARVHRNDYSAIFWVTGKTRESLRQGFVRIAERIQLPDVLENRRLQSSEDRISNTIQSVKRWLAQPDNFHWLLILDSIDAQELDLPNAGIPIGADEAGCTKYDARPYFQIIAQGTVIITTRLPDVAAIGVSLEIKRIAIEEDNIAILCGPSNLASNAER